MNTISAVYKITNTITGDFYIGSSKNVKLRWESHKWPSTWNKYPNKQLYLDMQKYGIDKFEFQVIVEIEAEHLKEKEQEFIEKMHPTYNNYRANGRDFDRRKKSQKEYQKSNKRKKYEKEYNHQICSYNSETLTLSALSSRFRRKGIPNPTQEAKKYLI